MVETIVENERMQHLFMVLQRKMLTELEGARTILEHPTTMGDSFELEWINWLKKYLPERYCIDKAQVIDSEGNLSQQIDIIIYDRQYTPFIFNDNGAIYVPAESVYAVFEVKPMLNKANMIYAAEKAESVRNLHRTSAPIIHAGGRFDAVAPKQIIAGILTYDCEWVEGLKDTFIKNLEALRNNQILNIGCSLKKGTFYMNSETDTIQVSSADESLVYFFLKLFKELQNVGTVPAMDINEYGKFLENFQ
ncbi:hypothetical protein J6R97_00720 [bacterium]|nr:hypothetical protein [bacterium]